MAISRYIHVGTFISVLVLGRALLHVPKSLFSKVSGSRTSHRFIYSYTILKAFIRIISCNCVLRISFCGKFCRRIISAFCNYP